jgi:serine/threonine protein phosphatase PrpC
MEAVTTLRAAGDTDPGLQRDGNEDQYHVDVNRGVFMVIDGVGGQAAGGQAADLALAMLRARLERETGPPGERVREAITIANNEIHRLAGTRPDWTGMACVLTVALVKDGQATIGHVGDTRLYKIRRDRIEKITRDHSPVGEREDSGELSESEAMRHPRRNEVYRDVGSDLHQPGDPEFVDLETIAFEEDAALLLCSDGLSDLVRASSIAEIVTRFAGDPGKVVHGLIEAANDAGGKDNVTAVYVEGERFASALESPPPDAADRAPAGVPVAAPVVPWRRPLARIAIVILILLLIGFVFARPRVLRWLSEAPPGASAASTTGDRVVQPGESITDAVGRASRGALVVVEPGEYREQVSLRDNIRVVSRVPRGATIRLPIAASEADAAVIAEGLSGADFVGFRIVGDAATPLGTGLRLRDAALSIVDVEIVGATKAAIEFSGIGGVLIGSEVHDNAGAAMVIRAGASPRISHNAFARNGMSERAGAPFTIEAGGHPLFQWNVFSGIGPEAFVALDEDARLTLTQHNWFPRLHASRSPALPSRGARPPLGR